MGNWSQGPSRTAAATNHRPASLPFTPQVIADSETDGGLAGACDKFKAWVDKTYLAEQPKSA